MVHDLNKYWKELKRESKVKECFCANSECSSNIIKAHSIQNNRILKRISENGYVMQLKPSILDDEFSVEPGSIGRKTATTLTNFCGFHDTQVFVPIETKNYEKGNKKQEFLFAYRAFAREYHAKKEVKNIFESVRKNPDANRNYLDQVLLGNNSSLEQLERERDKFNSALKDSDFDSIATHVIEFRCEYHIASSSAFCINYDLRGNRINDLSDLEKDFRPVFMTVFPQAGKTFILFGFYRKHRKLFSFIRRQVMAESLGNQKIIISNLLLSYVENLVISPKLWKEFSEAERQEIISTFQDAMKLSKDPLSSIKNINLFVNTQ